MATSPATATTREVQGRQQRPATNRGDGMPKGGKSFTPRPKPVEYEQPIPDPNEQIRLNKYMANAGICSRREADEFITRRVWSRSTVR